MLTWAPRKFHQLLHFIDQMMNRLIDRENKTVDQLMMKVSYLQPYLKPFQHLSEHFKLSFLILFYSVLFTICHPYDEDYDEMLVFGCLYVGGFNLKRACAV